MVGIQCCDYALDRVIKQNGAYSDFYGELKTMSIREVRLELTDWFALIVEDGPSGAGPSWSYRTGSHNRLIVRTNYNVSIEVTRRHWTGLRLSLFLNLTTETV